MSHLIVDMLALARPALPPGFILPETFDRMACAATHMVSLPRVGIECRLGVGQSQVDLQQCIYARDGEPEQLLAWLDDLLPRGAQPADEAWQRLHRFCVEWARTGSQLRRDVPEVFLEFDLPAGLPLAGQPDRLSPPSMFFALGSPTRPTAHPAVLAGQALALLGSVPAAMALSPALLRCFAACSERARIAHLGLMLSRPLQVVRVNVKGLTPEQTAPFLAAIGWPGDVDTAAIFFASALDRCDHATLALDAGAQGLYPSLGVECFLTEQPASEQRWADLLEELVADGLCTAAKRRAFLAVPGDLTPPASQQPWPAPWMAASLCAPPDQFTILNRRLTHIKLTLRPDGSREAKGYFRMDHLWRSPGRSPGAAAALPAAPPIAARHPQPTGATAENRGIQQAIARAVAFLIERRSQAGWWREFRVPPRMGDEWVSAYIAAHLARLPDPVAHAAASQVWRRLCARRAGWGYSRLTPPDADSTAWALRLAAALGEAGAPHARQALDFLRRHMSEAGGLTTYQELEPIYGYDHLTQEALAAGWYTTHTCVTAAAAPLLGEPPLAFLRCAQQPTGAWHGYWWSDDEYTTALAVEALVQARKLTDRPRIQAAAEWACRRLGADGAVYAEGFGPSPFAAAWNLRILAGARDETAMAALNAAVAWLICTQDADGGWPASARLHVPIPNAAKPGGIGGNDVLDEGRVFTTATVIAALHLAGNVLSWRSNLRTRALESLPVTFQKR